MFLTHFWFSVMYTKLLLFHFRKRNSRCRVNYLSINLLWTLFEQLNGKLNLLSALRTWSIYVQSHTRLNWAVDLCRFHQTLPPPPHKFFEVRSSMWYNRWCYNLHLNTMLSAEAVSRGGGGGEMQLWSRDTYMFSLFDCFFIAGINYPNTNYALCIT